MNTRGFMKGAVCGAAVLSLGLPITSHATPVVKNKPETEIIDFRFSLDELAHSQLYSFPFRENTPETSSPIVTSGAAINITDFEHSVAENTDEKENENNISDLAISIAETYVSVRKKPSTQSKLLGKLYKGSAAKIKRDCGDWVEVKSGSLNGYIKKEFLATGEKAEKLADKYTKKKAIVQAKILNVRDKKSKTSDIVAQIAKGSKYKVLQEEKKWVEIELNHKSGFVSKDYIEVKESLKKAISIQEEKAAESKKIAQRALSRQAAANLSSDHSSSYHSVKTSGKQSLRSEIVQYAMNFLGNPYIYGGTSLTNGIDCSAFTQAILRKFNIHIPRTSREQAGTGKRIDISEAIAGDLIFYSNGKRINHVVLCIGNGKVISASSPKTGIRICDMNYRNPVCARRVL